MSDAKYHLILSPDYGKEYIEYKNDHSEEFNRDWKTIPTYTVSELLYKLHEWIVSKDGVEQGGLIRTQGSLLNSLLSELSDDFCHYSGYQDATYIKSLASLLIQCYKKDIDIERKDIGNTNSE